jgi:hypothetical protein
MRLVLLSEKIIGKELAMSIYLSNGMVYAKKGLTLNEKNIKILKNVGIDTVYIQDENEDVNLRELLKTPIRIEITNDLKNVFDNIKKNNTVDEKTITNIVDKIIKNIDVSENSFLLNNLGEKDEYSKLISHSILWLALLAVNDGNNMRYEQDRLEKFATGALLHD